MARLPVDALTYDRRAVGSRLRGFRATLGMTQSDVAWYAGITQAALSNYENGKRDVPLPSLLSLARVLRISPIDLVPEFQLAPEAAGPTAPPAEA